MHDDLEVLGVDIFKQAYESRGSTDFQWHNDVEGESNPYGRRIVRTVVIKITAGTSHFTIAGYEDIPYDVQPGAWVSFCAAAQHRSAELQPGDDHIKVAIFLGYRTDE